MSTLQETLAVDLYVLERAFASTHPASEALFSKVGLFAFLVLDHQFMMHSTGFGRLRRGTRREEMEARWSETRCWYVTESEICMRLLTD